MIVFIRECESLVRLGTGEREAGCMAFMELSMASVELEISENKGYPEKIDKQMNDEGFQGVHHVRTRSGFW